MDTSLASLFLSLNSAPLIYALLFMVLILSEFLPIPEEATLILGGYLVYLQFIDFWPAVYALFAGIIAADILGYTLGRWCGDGICRPVSRLRYISLALEKGRKFFDKYGEATVFFSRAVTGVRVAVPILAGHFRMNFVKFIFFDMLSAFPWTLILVYLSYYLGSGLELLTQVKEIRYLIFTLLLGFIVIIIAYRSLKKSVIKSRSNTTQQ